jgi:2-phospho-L-lactate transferase CofD
VLPIINTNHSTHIAAKLPCPPYVIVGQNQISHPPAEEITSTGLVNAHFGSTDEEEGVSLPGSLASLNGTIRNLVFTKVDGGDALPGKIEKLYYVNPYGNEVFPSANPRVLSALRAADALIYSIGSLFTRSIPSSL